MAATEERTIHELKMDVRFNACYHMIVERWFRLLNDATTFVSLILFSSVLLSLYRQVEEISIAMVAIGSLLHAINITYGSSRKAQEHRDLYREFQALDAKLSSKTLSLDAGEQAYREIEVKEPPQSRRFARIAHAQNLRSHGHREEYAQAEAELTLIDRFVRWML